MPQLKKTVLLIILFLTSCQDWNYERVSFLQISTSEATDITSNTARLGGVIEGLRTGVTVDQHGHVWSATAENPVLDAKSFFNSKGKLGNQSFTSQPTGLLANTLYYFRAYAILKTDTLYGEVAAFRTRNFTLSVGDGSGVTIENGCFSVRFAINGYIGDSDRLGMVWSASREEPTIADPDRKEENAVFLDCSGGCPISLEACGLAPNTNYYLRAFLLPGGGQVPVYSEVLRFHTFPAPAGWRRLNDFPGGARTAGGGVIDQRAFIGGGFDGATLFQDTWEYEPDNDTWRRRADHPGLPPDGRIIADVYINSKIYLMIERATISPTIFWSYDPRADIWLRLPDLHISLKVGKAITIGNLAFYVDANNHILEFNPEKTTIDPWQTVDTLLYSATFIGEVDGKGYLIGNRPFNANYSTIWAYDPNAPRGERLTLKDDFPGNTRLVLGVFALNGKIYAGPGEAKSANTSPYPSEFWAFDPHAPAGRQWRRMPDFGGPGRREVVAFALNDKGYVFGGRTQTTFFKDFWEFTPPE